MLSPSVGAHFHVLQSHGNRYIPQLRKEKMKNVKRISFLVGATTLIFFAATNVANAGLITQRGWTRESKNGRSAKYKLTVNGVTETPSKIIHVPDDDLQTSPREFWTIEGVILNETFDAVGGNDKVSIEGKLQHLVLGERGGGVLFDNPGDLTPFDLEITLTPEQLKDIGKLKVDHGEFVNLERYRVKLKGKQAKTGLDIIEYSLAVRAFQKQTPKKKQSGTKLLNQNIEIGGRLANPIPLDLPSDPSNPSVSINLSLADVIPESLSATLAITDPQDAVVVETPIENFNLGLELTATDDPGEFSLQATNAFLDPVDFSIPGFEFFGDFATLSQSGAGVGDFDLDIEDAEVLTSLLLETPGGITLGSENIIDIDWTIEENFITGFTLQAESSGLEKVPEPASTLSLLALGTLGAAGLLRRKQRS